MVEACAMEGSWLISKLSLAQTNVRVAKVDLNQVLALLRRSSLGSMARFGRILVGFLLPVSAQTGCSGTWRRNHLVFHSVPKNRNSIPV
jgi:hypothetical protein